MVGANTVGRHALVPELPVTTFGFCDAPHCDVVYVGTDGTLIRKDRLRTRVGVKETEDPIPVCYCFGLTADQIARDLVANGRSTIRAYAPSEPILSNRSVRGAVSARSRILRGGAA